MTNTRNYLETLEDIIQRDPRYKIDAYNFVLEALNYTVTKLEKPRHVSGKELLEGVKQYLKEQFGPMARTVIEHWGIKSTEDIGHIVFNLVDAKILSKTEQDSLDDFKNAFDISEIFS